MSKHLSIQALILALAVAMPWSAGASAGDKTVQERESNPTANQCARYRQQKQQFLAERFPDRGVNDRPSLETVSHSEGVTDQERQRAAKLHRLLENCE